MSDLLRRGGALRCGLSSGLQRVNNAFVSLGAVWQGLRQWCGDADYDRYLRAVAARRTGPVLSREQFYLDQLHRRYSRPSRCC
jgi:uncharacterized short protein YbdD (DUF466 family)